MFVARGLLDMVSTLFNIQVGPLLTLYHHQRVFSHAKTP